MPKGRDYPLKATPDGVDMVTVFEGSALVTRRTTIAGIRHDLMPLGHAFYDLRDPLYGGAGDGVTDNSSALTTLLAAMPSTGGIIYIAEGDWRFGSGVIINKPVTIMGAGINSTTIKTTFASGDLFTIAAQFTTIAGIAFNTTVTRTSGAYVKYPTGSTASWGLLDAVRMDGWYMGIDIATDVGPRISRCGVFFPSAGSLAGIRVTAGNDVYIDKVTMNTGANKPSAGGIYIVNTGCLNITDCDIIGMGTCLKIEGGFSIYALNSYFDTSTRGIWIDPVATVARVHFIGCWASSHSSDGFKVGGTGTASVEGLEIIGHQGSLNAGHGLYVSDHVSDVQVIGGLYAGNTGNGITVGANLSRIGIIGATVGPEGSVGGNANGIVVNAGTGDYFRILGNNLVGNTGAALTNGATGVNSIVAENLPSSVNTAIAHSALSGLTTGDPHTQYAYLAGRAGGQAYTFGTGAGEGGTFITTSHSTKGKLYFGAGQTTAYDGVNDRWGVGTASPAVHIEASGSGNAGTEIRATANNAGASSQAIVRATSDGGNILAIGRGSGATGAFAGTSASWSHILATQGNGLVIGTNFSAPFLVATNNIEALRVDTSQNVIVGAAAAGTSAAKVLAVASGTAPSSSPADMAQLYSKDAAAGDANLYVRNEAGEVARLTGRVARVSTQFDKTNSAVLANVTGLTRNVEAGLVYAFEAILYTISGSSGGVQAAIAGTATATAIVYEAIVWDGAAVKAQTKATALGTTVGGVTAVTAAQIRITGTITVNAAGTLTVQFAQNASNGTTSSVLVGSTFEIRGPFA